MKWYFAVWKGWFAYDFLKPFFGCCARLRFGCSSRGQLRKYGNRPPGKGLCPLHSRQPFKKGWTLNFLCGRPFPRDKAQQAMRFGPAGATTGLKPSPRSSLPANTRRPRRPLGHLHPERLLNLPLGDVVEKNVGVEFEHRIGGTGGFPRGLFPSAVR